MLLSRQLHTVGIWESEVAQRLADIDAELDATGNPTLAYLASQGQTLVRITAKAASADDATAMIDAVDARVRAALGDVVYGADEETLESVVQAALLRAGATVATAESLTGGLLGAALTKIAGSSTTYRGGVVAYATDAKEALLGVLGPLARGARRGQRGRRARHGRGLPRAVRRRLRDRHDRGGGTRRTRRQAGRRRVRGDRRTGGARRPRAEVAW